mmetsp:Transcript_9328/g.26155  ORF Transcript_9328/g.26155 Transcript_9328/m.26155 type:complete len:294 (+) Transcript_9328:912-1793(+)
MGVRIGRLLLIARPRPATALHLLQHLPACREVPGGARVCLAVAAPAHVQEDRLQRRVPIPLREVAVRAPRLLVGGSPRGRRRGRGGGPISWRARGEVRQDPLHQPVAGLPREHAGEHLVRWQRGVPAPRRPPPPPRAAVPRLAHEGLRDRGSDAGVAPGDQHRVPLPRVAAEADAAQEPGPPHAREQGPDDEDPQKEARGQDLQERDEEEGRDRAEVGGREAEVLGRRGRGERVQEDQACAVGAAAETAGPWRWYRQLKRCRRHELGLPSCALQHPGCSAAGEGAHQIHRFNR